jgi:hypothetical protein
MNYLRATLASLAAVFFPCTPLHAQELAYPSVSVGIVGWPTSDSTEMTHGFGGDIEECLTKHIHEVAPEIVVVTQRAIRDALFPLLEPSTQPATEEDFAALLAREDVRARLAHRGLRYLIAFAGGTIARDVHAFGVCSYTGCLVFAWSDETTRLDAALWSLDNGTAIRHEGARVEGTNAGVVIVLLPVGISARTKANACRELGTRIGLAIRQSAAQSPEKQ